MPDKRLSEARLGRANLTMAVVVLWLGVLTIVSYLWVDEVLLGWLAKDQEPWHNNYWLSTLGLLGKGWLLIWLLLVWFCATRRVRPVLVGLLALALVGPTVATVKVAVRRPRPSETDRAPPGVRVSDDRSTRSRHLSFPSGDTAVVFAVAAGLACFTGRGWAAVLFGVSGGVGLIRAGKLSHYLSDVTAGAAIGVLSAWLALLAVQRWGRLLPYRANLSYGMALAGVILIPVYVQVFEGADRLVMFLKSYAPMAAGAYLIARAGRWPGKTQESDGWGV